MWNIAVISTLHSRSGNSEASTFITGQIAPGHPFSTPSTPKTHHLNHNGIIRRYHNDDIPGRLGCVRRLHGGIRFQWKAWWGVKLGMSPASIATMYTIPSLTPPCHTRPSFQSPEICCCHACCSQLSPRPRCSPGVDC